MSPVKSFYQIYNYTIQFCYYETLIRKTKWWDFPRRKMLREAQDFIYPLMAYEIGLPPLDFDALEKQHITSVTGVE